MFLDRKPFHIKNKLFYQTKINLWEKDLNKFYINLNKKKWSFLRPRFGKNKVKRLDTFRYQPLSFNPSKGRIRFNYKNNLYLKKLIRLKYGRLKNKEFYSLFKKSKDCNDLVANLGSRLDVILFNFLSPVSIFLLRQRIIHGNVLVNGLTVKSPNIQIKPLDIISFNLINLFNEKNFINKREHSLHTIDLISELYGHAHFRNLTADSQEKFIKNLAEALFGHLPSYGEQFIDFLKEDFQDIAESEDLKNEDYAEGGCFRLGKRLMPLKEYIQVLKSFYILDKIRYFLYTRKHYNSFFGRSKYFLSNENNSTGLFTNELISNSIEIFLNGFYVDIVFLGYSFNIEDSIKKDNQQKYLLHYLYQK